MRDKNAEEQLQQQKALFAKVQACTDPAAKKEILKTLTMLSKSIATNTLQAKETLLAVEKAQGKNAGRKGRGQDGAASGRRGRGRGRGRGALTLTRRNTLDKRTCSLLVEGCAAVGVDAAGLRTHFENFGVVDECRLEGEDRAFVTFQSRAAAEDAVAKGTTVGDSEVTVTWYEQSDPPQLEPAVVGDSEKEEASEDKSDQDTTLE